MKIERLEVKGFGRLKDLALDLEPGINIIFGHNECGKSTLQAFIKAMLYGLKGGRTGKDGLLPPLKRYRPWSGMSFGGIIQYRLSDNSSYRVERNFLSNSTRIFDGFFNDITDRFAVSSEKGVQFAELQLGMNETCFEKTVFVKQMDSKLDNAAGSELVNKLINTGQTGFDDISLKNAIDALKNALKTYIGTDKTSTRPLDRINNRLKELYEVKASLIDKRNSMMVIDDELSEAKTAAFGLEDEKKALLKLEELIQLKRDEQLNKCKNEKLQKLIEDMNLIIREIQEYDHKASSVEINNYSGMATAARSRKEDLKRSGRMAAYGAALSAVCVVISTAYGVLKDWRSLAAAPVFLLGAIILTVIKNRFYDRLNKLIDKRNTGTSLSEDGQGGILGKYKLENRLKDVYTQASLVCNIHIDSKQMATDQLNSSFRAYSSAKSLLDAYKSKMDKTLSDAKFENPVLQIKCKQLIYSNVDVAFLDEIDMMRKTEFERACSDLNYVMLKIKENETLLKSNSLNEGEIQGIEEEIFELEAKKAQLTELDQSLKIALELLTEAGLEMQRDFAPALNQSVSRILSDITCGRYNGIKIDDSLSVKVIAPETGGIVDARHLSGGTADQAYLALRLAVGEMALSPGGLLPFIMDEVFAQYDDTRITQTLRYLAEISSERQVILFTCKKREMHIASEVFKDNLNIINLSGVG